MMKKILYNPVINKVVRTAVKPFSTLIPEGLRFPVTGTIKLRVPGGESILIRCNPTSFVARKLFWEGMAGFEAVMSQLFVRLVRDANVFLDIGANIGYYSLLAASINPHLKIFSFEPAPEVFSYLKKNIEINGFDIQAEQKAISDKIGSLEFFVSRNPKYVDIADEHLTSTGSFDKSQADRTTILETINVEALTLDEYVAQKGIEKIDLIKLDTEATEHLVLAGAQRVLSEFKPVIFCEVLPGKVEQKIEAAFKAQGYLMYRLGEDRISAVESLAHTSAITNDHLMIHPDKLDVMSDLLAGNW